MKKHISNSHVVWVGLIAGAVIGIAAIMAVPADAARARHPDQDRSYARNYQHRG